jgi:hypothetical protein
MKKNSSKTEKVISELEKEFGGPAECKNCLNFERWIEDIKTKKKYTKCKHYDHLPNPEEAYRCYYYANKDERIRKNVAKMIEKGEELERKLKPTWEEMNRPFTI